MSYSLSFNNRLPEYRQYKNINELPVSWIIVIMYYTFMTHTSKWLYTVHGFYKLSYSFGAFLYHCIYGCTFCMLQFNFENYVFYCYVYVFFLLCVFSVFCFIVFFCVVCENVYCDTATGCQPYRS